MAPNQLVIHTDGACHGNPGPGGYAAWWSWNKERWELLGGSLDTTNNRMELGAVLAALRAIEQAQSQGMLLGVESIVIRSDSQYFIKGFSEWMPGWKRKGWIGSDKKPVKNQDIWKLLDAQLGGFSKPWSLEWVKGHSGDPHNEHADALAQEAVGIIKANRETSMQFRRRIPES